MSIFYFILKHILEVRMRKANKLSRRLDLKVEVKNKIKKGREKDEEVVKVVKKMNKWELREDEYKIIRELLLNERKIYICWRIKS